MKRIVSFILIVVILAMSLSSCNTAGNTANNNETPESEAHVHAFSPATCAAPKTCTDCGYTEGEKLNRHEPNGDVCSVCGLDFFEELVNLIKQNDNDGNDKSICYKVDKSEIYYLEDTRGIRIRQIGYQDDDATISYSAIITRGAMRTQNYEWYYSYLYFGGDFFHSESAEGTFDPREFTAAKNFEWTEYDNCSPGSIASVAPGYIDDSIKNVFIPLLKMSDKNLRPSDYGFVNYD